MKGIRSVAQATDRRPRRTWMCRRTTECGQSTVEFALVLPVVVAAVFVALELGLLARDQVLVAHAAREAARVAAVDADVVHIHEAAERSGLTSFDLDLQRPSEVGGMVVVTVRARRTIGRILGSSLSRAIALEASVTMRVEGPP